LKIRRPIWHGGKKVKHLVEFPLEDGGSIVVEVDEPETSGTIRAGRGDTIEKARETLEEALNKVLPAAKSVVEKLHTMGNAPDEIEVTFGVKLTTVAGAVIASASVEANFDVTLRWVGKTQESSH
jgi:predicted RNase H-like HicB family nuclease